MILPKEFNLRSLGATRDWRRKTVMSSFLRKNIEIIRGNNLEKLI